MKKLIIILGVAGTAVSAILVRFADAPSTVLVFYRMLFSVMFLLPSLVYTHREECRQLRIKEALPCIVSGLFLGFHFTCYFESLRYTSIASSVVLVDTEVFFVAAAGILFLNEKISKWSWLGLIITFFGSVLVAAGDAGKGRLIGDILALLGAICSAVYTVIGRKCRTHMSTTVYTAMVYLFAGLVVLTASLARHEKIVSCGRENILIALGLAVFCTLLGHSIFSWGLKYEKASFVSVVKLLEPVFASVMGIVIFDEIPIFTSVIGGTIIITGIIIVIISLKH